MTWWGGLDLVFLNLFRTWFHVEIWFWRFCFVESNHPQDRWTKGHPLFCWRSFWRSFFRAGGALWDTPKKKDGSFWERFGRSEPPWFQLPGELVVMLRQTGTFSTSSRKDGYCLPGREPRNDDVEWRCIYPKTMKNEGFLNPQHMSIVIARKKAGFGGHGSKPSADRFKD